MEELSKELVNEIKDYYKKYKSFTMEKKDLSAHNRDLKNDFMDTHFPKENNETEDVKRIKKEITKYFTTILECDNLIEPVREVKELRKTHLNFEEDVYDDLMTIFKQIVKNNDAKEVLDDRLEKEVYLKVCNKLGLSLDIVKGILKLWIEIENGKFPVALTVAANYRELIAEVEKGEQYGSRL